MRAVRYYAYGGPEVLRVEEVTRPTPARGEVLVRVRWAATNPKDCMLRKGRFRLLSGNRFPQGVGSDLAGEVAEVGPGVEGLRVGQRVHGMIQGWRGSTYAEYVVARADQVGPVPEGLPLREAAAIPLAGMTALQSLRDLAHLGSGQTVLLNGAAGGVGTFAIQIAGLLGARSVAVCSARNHALCRELGAHEVRDYAEGGALRDGDAFDAFFDVFGNYRFGTVRAALTARGCYVTTVPKRPIFVDWLRTSLSRQRARLVVVRSRRADLALLDRWWTEGGLRPVIDRTFGLAEAAAAHAYLETKRARGKVLIEIG